MGAPNVYPTGVTIYNPEKAWSGYTLLPAREIGAVLLDMNGNVVKTWKGLQGFPNKLLPNGDVFGHLGVRNTEFGYQDQTDLVQVDWNGKVVWKFDHKEYIEDEGETPQWMARCHHDYQREGNPVGYYVPGMACKVDSGNTMILCHENCYNTRISDKRLLDDAIIEVDWAGNIIWQWRVSEHFRELGFSETVRNALYRNPNMHSNGGGMGDWMHINAMSLVGPNKWYDAGDERFNPANIIWDAREANITAIISKETGKIVWKMGPDFTESQELRRIGQIIGQHHAHIIPQGLPGAGNILIFDNGGWAGYGSPGRTSKDGTKTDLRDHSRIVEIDPVAMKLVWEFSGADLGKVSSIVAASKFYSPLISAAQRLPNGNTLITEGNSCRLLEVTADKEVVWEFIAPFSADNFGIYRAYRYPYSYAPLAEQPVETPVARVNNLTFRVPGAAPCVIDHEVAVDGARGWAAKVEECVVTDESELKQIAEEDEDDIIAKF